MLREQLADLQLDYLDMYLMHGPLEIIQDPERPHNIFPMKADGSVDLGKTSQLDTWRVKNRDEHLSN